MKSKLIICILACFYFLFSCETEIDLELDDAGKAVVVEGTIFEGEFPFLTITNTYSFYDVITVDSFDSLFVGGAEVLMWVDEDTVELVENNLEFDDVSLTFYAPDIETPNIERFVGQRGKTYHLQIEVENNIYTASTYIPNQTSIDSIWYESHPNEEKYEDLVQVYVKTSDADTLGNMYRVFTQRNDEDFYTEDGSIFDDSVINGTSYEVPVSRAPAPFDEEDDFETYGYFEKGDELVVRRCGIDQGVFDFFSTLEYNSQGGGGPFGSATIINSNIEGGSEIIGVWAGYSVEEANISIPE